MSKKSIHIIFKLIGIGLMTITFLVVPDTNPWYYEFILKVLLFNIGLGISMIPKFPKLKRKLIKIKANL